MNAVFADTSFYLALLDQQDPFHVRARTESQRLQEIVTTEFVMLELGNACAQADDHDDFLALIAGMRASPHTTIVSLDSALLQRGLDLLAGRPDKDWSLTDCVSFVVMEDHALQEALTSDHHFEQAGFKALLK